MLRENDRKFFEPIWRRYAVTIFCAAWSGWEWFNGETMWSTMVGGIAIYCVWAFFIKFDQNKKAD